MKILKYILSFFPSNPNFGLGALPNPTDHRNIDIASVQMPVNIPTPYDTDLSMFIVENQGSKPICVGMSFGEYAEYIVFKMIGKVIRVDKEKLYLKCKKEDGIPEISGTYPSVMAKIICRDGVEDEYGIIYKVSSGYAFVSSNFTDISQAIYQNGVISCGFLVDTNWFIGKIIKVLQSIGGHQVILTGYDSDKLLLRGKNSWGNWIGYIAGIINPKIKPGYFEARFEDVKDTMMNIMVLTPIPKNIIEEKKSKTYRFLKTLKMGSTGYDVIKLQETLGINADGSFGRMTLNAVVDFQKKSGLIADGVAGIATLSILNKTAIEIIPIMAKAIQNHEGYYSGSRAYRNCSPGNFKIGSGILTEYMKKLGSTGLDKDDFVIFPDYETGFKALCIFLKDSFSGNLRPYKDCKTISDYIHVYAPMSENNTELYISRICKEMNCPSNTPIGLLI